MPVSLNHLNLVVSDLDAAEAFFANHFFFTVRTRHAALVVLDGVDGFVLVLMRARETAPAYPGGFHVGFLVADNAAVDVEYARLTTAGLAISKPPRSMRGTYGFYFTALDGILFEVAAR
jgi:catechol 2,3-dioxygenase-like lactoylglutathione lyase family enzyme